MHTNTNSNCKKVPKDFVHLCCRDAGENGGIDLRGANVSNLKMIRVGTTDSGKVLTLDQLLGSDCCWKMRRDSWIKYIEEEVFLQITRGYEAFYPIKPPEANRYYMQEAPAVLSRCRQLRDGTREAVGTRR